MYTFIFEHKGSIRVFIKVKTQARINAILGVSHDGTHERLIIAIQAVREKGKANEMLITFLSQVLETAKSNIILVKGTTLPHKEIAIYNASYESVLNRLMSR